MISHVVTSPSLPSSVVTSTAMADNGKRRKAKKVFKLFEELGEIIASDELEGYQRFLRAGLLLGEEDGGIDRAFTLADGVLEDRGIKATFLYRGKRLCDGVDTDDGDVFLKAGALEGE